MESRQDDPGSSAAGPRGQGVGDELADSVVDNRFRIGPRLGKGGTADVFRAVDLSTGEVVAFKLLRPIRAIPLQVQIALFEREYRTLASMRYRGIVEVRAFGRRRGMPYYAMELVSGTDASFAPERSVPEIRALLASIASALAHVHSHGLVLRDLSAKNVLIDDLGEPRLIDFGGVVTRGSQPEEVVGTPPFVAPEVLWGEPVVAATDLFALGALGYLMLTGVHAFPAKGLPDLPQLWRKEPKPIPRMRHGVPAQLRALISGLLSTDASRRPSIAETLAVLGHGRDPVSRAASAVPERDAIAAEPPLIERAGQIEAIDNRIAALRKGLGGVVRIEGVHGAGRTRMLRATKVHCELAGVRALEASSHGEGPFVGARRLVQALGRTDPDASTRATAVLAEWDARATAPGEDATRVLAESPENMQRTQELLAETVARAFADRPLVILIDDVDECDLASAGFVEQLVRAAVGSALLLVVTGAEDISWDHPLAAVCNGGHVVSVPAISLDGTTVLLASIFGSTLQLHHLAAALHRRAEGRPAAVVNAIRALIARGVARRSNGVWSLPEDVRSLQLALDNNDDDDARALAAISNEALEAGAALAVLGSSFDVTLALTMLDVGANSRVVHLPELVTAGVLECSGRNYRFRVPAIQERLRERLSPTAAQALHRAAARVLLSSSAPDATALAIHLDEAGDDGAAVALEDAGVRALLVQNIAEAVPLLERALSHHRRTRSAAAQLRVLELLIEASFYGDPTLLDRYGPTAFDLAARHAGLDIAAVAGPRVGPRIGLLVGMVWACLRYVVGRGSAPPTPAASLRAFLVLVALAAGLCTVRDDREGVARINTRLAPLRHAPLGGALVAQTVAGMEHALCGRSRAAIRCETATLRALERSPLALPARDRSTLRAAAHQRRGFALALDGDPDALLDFDAADALGEPRLAGLGVAMRLVYFGARAEVREFESWRERLERSTRSRVSAAQIHRLVVHAIGAMFETTGGAYWLAMLQQGVDRAAEASPIMRAQSELVRALQPAGAGEHANHVLAETGPSALAALRELAPEHISVPWWMNHIAEALLHAGRVAAATDLAAETIRWCDHRGQRRASVWARCTEAEAIALAGRPDEGDARLDRALAVAQAVRNPVLVGRVHETRHRMALGRGDALAAQHYIALANAALGASSSSRLASGEDHGRLSARPRAMPSDAPTGAESTAGLVSALRHRVGVDALAMIRNSAQDPVALVSPEMRVPPEVIDAALESFDALPVTADDSTRSEVRSLDGWMLHPVRGQGSGRILAVAAVRRTGSGNEQRRMAEASDLLAAIARRLARP